MSRKVSAAPCKLHRRLISFVHRRCFLRLYNQLKKRSMQSRKFSSAVELFRITRQQFNKLITDHIMRVYTYVDACTLYTHGLQRTVYPRIRMHLPQTACLCEYHVIRGYANVITSDIYRADSTFVKIIVENSCILGYIRRSLLLR